uniref:Uncharacterized protein n=1 Tax=Hippocampus comes TaxID=109280 RepID=A0A3Q2XZJ3_HIPCM
MATVIVGLRYRGRSLNASQAEGTETEKEKDVPLFVFYRFAPLQKLPCEPKWGCTGAAPVLTRVHWPQCSRWSIRITNNSLLHITMRDVQQIVQ